jgi:hypothetical protein
MMALGDDILALDDRRMESVVVPEWGGAEIYVREMGATERAAYEGRLIEDKDLPLEQRMVRVKVLIAILCACDAGGARLWTLEQYDAVAAKNGEALNRIFDLANKVNRVTDAAIEEDAGN